VPLQQSGVVPFTPDVPSLIGKACTSWFSSGMAVTVAEAVFEGSATELATTLYVIGARIGAGALYWFPVINPGYEKSPGRSFTLHKTIWFDVPPTVPVYVIEKPAFTVAVAGEIVNVTGCELIVTIADADRVGVPGSVAVTMAVPPLGTDVGPT